MAANQSNAIRGWSLAKAVSGAEYYKAIGTGNNAVLGLGRQGDYISQVTAIVTNNLNCAITIQDGGDAAITILPNVIPLGNQTVTIPLGLSCRNNNWFVSCNAGVSALVAGVW